MSKTKPNSAQSATGHEEPSLRAQVAKSNLALLPALSGKYIVVEKPVWNELAGELSRQGVIVLHLANQAHAERAILREFNRSGWRWLIPDPIELSAVGDATQERRHAIHHLNQHQVPTQLIHFLSAYGGLIGWCDAYWIAQNGKLNDRSS